MSNTIKKPWGTEIILTPPNLPYTAKILTIKANQQLSLQSHDQKTETLTLINGQAQISLGPDQNSLTTQDMLPLTGYTIKPNSIHRLKAISDCQIFEASTPEQGTTKRLADDYNRSDETEKVRNSPHRGWQ